MTGSAIITAIAVAIVTTVAALFFNTVENAINPNMRPIYRVLFRLAMMGLGVVIFLDAISR